MWGQASSSEQHAVSAHIEADKRAALSVLSTASPSPDSGVLLSVQRVGSMYCQREKGWKFAQVLTSCNSTKEELVEEFCGVTATRPADGVGTSSTADLLARVDIGAASGASISCQCSDSKNVTATQTEGESAQGTTASKATLPPFELVDWVKTYPTFRFGGFEGTRVCTVAFCRLP